MDVKRMKKTLKKSKEVSIENLKSNIQHPASPFFHPKSKILLLLLATDHDSFDYKMIEKETKLIIDTRGKINNSEKVVKA